MGRFGRFDSYISFDSSVAFERNDAFRNRCYRGQAVKAVKEHGIFG